jgi:pSer/pThr/pTyr-binding forkhead associated (FHA) protein
MRARLISLDEGSDIPVGGVPVLIGRNPRCDARLDSIRVSRLHCCLAAGEGGVLVRDLLSTNGIRINGQRVEWGRLGPGDELSIAHLRFRVVDEPEGPRPDDSTEQSSAPPPLHT